MRELAERVEGGFGFVVEGFGFGVLFAEAFDDVGGGFGREGFVAELLVGGGEAFFVFGEVFGEALAFGGDVDLALVDDGYVEVGGAAGVGAGEWVGGELDGVGRGPCGRACPGWRRLRR